MVIKLAMRHFVVLDNLLTINEYALYCWCGVHYTTLSFLRQAINQPSSNFFTLWSPHKLWQHIEGEEDLKEILMLIVHPTLILR